MIDFRYHLVSIVAVFLALAIGIVLGSTELQGGTLDVLQLDERLAEEPAHRRQAAARRLPVSQSSASDTFLQTAEPKLLAGMLTGESLVIVTEPGAPARSWTASSRPPALAGRHRHRHGRAPAEVQRPVSGANQVQPGRDQQLDSSAGDGTTLATGRQPADRLPAAGGAADRHRDPGPAPTAAVGLPHRRAATAERLRAGRLPDRSPAARRPHPRQLAVIVTPESAPADGQNDPANQVLLAVAQEFASAERGDPGRGTRPRSAQSGSAISVLRGEQRLQPGLERGQRGPDARPDLTIVGARRPAGGREAEQLRYLGCVRGQPGTVACAERRRRPTRPPRRHSTTTGEG